MSLETDIEKVIRGHGYRISAYTRDEISNLVDGIINEADNSGDDDFDDEEPWFGEEEQASI